MKSSFTLRSLFYFSCSLGLFLVFGCGDTEDTKNAPIATRDTFINEPGLDEEEYWEQFKDENWIRLTDAEVEELMNFEMPRWDFKQQTLEEFNKYAHAFLFQKFGDIPSVRYIVEFERQHPKESGEVVTLTPMLAKQNVACAEAMYFLLPTEVHKRSLEKLQEVLKVVEEQEEHYLLDHLRIEDPEAWIKRKRTFLIDKHGDIPEVDIIVNFLQKLELNLPRTDAECRIYYFEAYDVLYDDSNTASAYEFYAMLEALHQIRAFVEDPPSHRLEKYREARAEGISFYNIDWDDD